ncbi:Gallate 1-beta-glucosyltransferase 84A23 [Linum perenne]
MTSSHNDESPIHVLIVCYPSQGHINPTLRLADLLATHGLHVTFAINSSTGATMRLPSTVGSTGSITVGSTGSIQLDFFEDGLEPGDFMKQVSVTQIMPFLEKIGRKALPEMIKKYSEMGRPVSCLVSDTYLPWTFDVAATLDIPFAVLWTQSCASLVTHYHYHCGDVRFPTVDDPESDTVLPGMPALKHGEIPTFLHPRTLFLPLASSIVGESGFLGGMLCVFVDTFAELEPKVVDHLATICRVKPIGPIYNCATTHQTNIGGDLMDAENDCIEWLNGKEASKVVYVSMGTVVSLQPDQRDELAHGLINSGLPFLWVVRPNREEEESDFVLPDGLGVNGKVVRWAPQREVLAHQAVGCFVTHCGWNSTLEVIAAGKPVVACPIFADQVTNAKFLVDVYEVGVRMTRHEKTRLKRDDVTRLLVEATVGPKAEELRRNAARWKKKAEEAVAEGGSSKRSVNDFVEMVKKNVSKT